MAGVGERHVREHNARMLAAYWTARLGREKDMTPLADLLAGAKRKGAAGGRRVAKSPAEQKCAWDAWVIATGGALGEPVTAAPPEQESE